MSDVLGVYERHGHAWAKLRGADTGEGPWVARLVSLLAPGAAVLDLGCGSGVPIARLLVERGFAVTGVDGAAAMLALFRDNVPAAEAIHADMRGLALGRTFGAIVAWDSFFHLAPDEQRSMFARLRDHAEPGAGLLFTSGDVEGSAIGALEGEPLYHGSLDAEEYRTRLAAAGFTVLAHVRTDPASGDRTVWLAQRA